MFLLAHDAALRASRNVERGRADRASQALWVCGCGWTNGVNLSRCAGCDRAPNESKSAPFQAELYRQVADLTSKLEAMTRERDELRDTVVSFELEESMLKQQLADAQATIARLEAEKADMLLRNRLLRDRPDLPIERLEAYDQLQATVTREKEYAEKCAIELGWPGWSQGGEPVGYLYGELCDARAAVTTQQEKIKRLQEQYNESDTLP